MGDEVIVREVAMMATALSNAVNILTAPREAFAALRERPTALVPVLALLLANAAAVLWYYNVVDLVWLAETSLTQGAADIPADVREQALRSAASTPPMVLGSAAAVGSALAVLVSLSLMAGYLSVVSLVTNDGFKFRSWFSLVSWSSLPVLLASVAALVNVAVGDATHLPAERLNPFTFANLLGLEAGVGAARVLQQADVTTFWALGLMVLGYGSWTGKPPAAALSIVAAPLLVIVGIVLVFFLE